MASQLIELTATIVSAHASATGMTADQLLQEIQTVHAALKRLEAGEVTPLEGQPAAPAMQPKKSIQKNQVVCLICGKGGFKTLTRHLKQAHGMKPGEYRKQFGLPAGTALVAKGYSESRRQQALKNNLAGNLEKARAAKGAKNLKKVATAPAKSSKPAQAEKKATAKTAVKTTATKGTTKSVTKAPKKPAAKKG